MLPQLSQCRKKCRSGSSGACEKTIEPVQTSQRSLRERTEAFQAKSKKAIEPLSTSKPGRVENKPEPLPKAERNLGTKAEKAVRSANPVQTPKEVRLPNAARVAADQIAATSASAKAKDVIKPNPVPKGGGGWKDHSTNLWQ